MGLRAIVCLVLVVGLVSLAAAGCGKKGPPRPPDEASWQGR